MKFVEKALEMRAVNRNEIISYFIKTGGEEVENGRISGDGWKVDVGQESLVALGSFKITSIKVVIRCKEELFDQMYSKFCLAFFRAGG